MKVRELLATEDRWTHGCIARDRNGAPLIRASDRSAVCWCLMGALVKCYMHSISEHAIAERTIRREIGSIVDYNDAPARTFADIRALVERLDI